MTLKKLYVIVDLVKHKGGASMSDKEKIDISDTVKILMQLDKQSLLLIDSGAELLAARQDMGAGKES